MEKSLYGYLWFKYWDLVRYVFKLLVYYGKWSLRNVGVEWSFVMLILLEFGYRSLLKQ